MRENHYSLIAADDCECDHLAEMLQRLKVPEEQLSRFCTLTEFIQSGTSTNPGQVLIFSMSDSQLPEELRDELHKLYSLPLIAIVPREKSSDGAKLLEMGVDDYLIKSCFDHHYLRKTIKQSLDRASGPLYRDSQFQALLEHNFDAVLVQDESTQILYASPSIFNLSGYRHQDVIGKDGFEFIHPEDVEPALEQFNQVAQGKQQQVEFKERVLVASGKYLWIEVRVTDCRSVPGIKALVANLRIIENEQRALQELRLEKSRLKRAMEIARMGYWSLDLETFKITWSAELYRMFGLEDTEEITYERFLNFVHPEDRDLLSVATVKKSPKGSSNFTLNQVEYRIITSSGELKWLRGISGMPSSEEGGKTLEGVLRDITIKKLAQEQRNKYMHQLQERVKEQSCLYSILKLRNQFKTLDQMFEAVVNILPTGYQNPKNTAAQLEFGGKTFQSEGFREDFPMMESGVGLNGKGRLQLRVANMGNPSPTGGEIFLQEEQNLLNSVVEIIGGSINEFEIHKELLSKENYLSTLFSNALAGIVVTDEDGNYVSVNQAAADFFEVSKEELLETDVETLQAQLSSEFPYDYKNFLGAGEDRGEAHVKTQGGQLKSALFHATHVRKNMNVCVLMDITARKEAQDQLAKSEEIYHILFDDAPLPKIVYEPENLAIQKVNQKAVELYGYTESELLEMKISDLFPKDYQPDDGNWTNRIASHNRHNFSTQHCTKKGEFRHLEVYATSFYFDNSTSYQVSLRDVTEERKYREEISKLSLVASNTDNAVLITDAEENIEWVNEGFERIFGYSAEEMKGKTPRMLQGTETSREERGYIRSMLQKKQAFKSTILNYTKDGRPVWIRMSISPVFDEDGEVRHFIAIESDVTEEKQKALKQELFASISHALSMPGSIHERLQLVLTELIAYAEFDVCEAWLTDMDKTHLNRVAQHHCGEMGKEFTELEPEFRHAMKGEGFPGAVWESGELLQWDDLSERKFFIRKSEAKDTGIKSAIGVPLSFKGDLVGVLVFLTSQTAHHLKGLQHLLCDLSERLAGELQRAKSEEQLNTFFELSPDLMCIAGTDGYLKRINPAFTQILGYTTEELQARPLDQFVHPDDRSSTRAELLSVSVGNHSPNFENRYLTSDGREIWLSWTSTILKESQLILAVAREITHQKELEIERANYLTAIEEQNEKLRTIAWIQSHVVRAPLARMMGLIELFNSHVLSTEERKMVLDQLNVSATELDEIIRGMIKSSSEIRTDLSE